MICTYTQIKLIALFLEMLPVKREISHSSNPFKSIWNPLWGALKRFSCLRRERGHLDTIIYKYYTRFWFPLHLLAWSPGPLRYTESMVGVTLGSIVSFSKDSGFKRAQATYSFKRHTWCSSVQFSSSVMSDSLWPHELQHARPPCPSPTPGVHPNPCPSSRWCHPTISSSVIPLSSCPQSFPASESSNESAFCIRWPKYWNFSFNISPTNEHPGLISFRMDWLDLLAVQESIIEPKFI